MSTDFTSAQVFVYGTLKRGESNHHLLAEAKFLGASVVEGPFTMVDLDGFPGVLTVRHPASTGCIHGEVYAVSPTTLAALDALEGYPDFYQRLHVATACGEAWMYVLADEAVDAMRLLPDGRWPP